jgi:LuxR family maltose regulon positive regulatory protein
VRRRHRPARRAGDCCEGVGAVEPLPRRARRPAAGGTATTTSSATCSVPASATNAPTPSPSCTAGQRLVRGGGDRGEAVHHALAAADLPRAAELIELTIRRSARPARRPPSGPGSTPSRPRSSPTGPSWHWGSSAPAWEPVTARGGGAPRLVEARLAPDRPDGGRAGRADHVELRRLPAQAAMYRAGPRPAAGRPGRHHRPRRAGDQPDRPTTTTSARRRRRPDRARAVGRRGPQGGRAPVRGRHRRVPRGRHLADVLACSLGLATCRPVWATSAPRSAPSPPGSTSRRRTLPCAGPPTCTSASRGPTSSGTSWTPPPGTSVRASSSESGWRCPSTPTAGASSTPASAPPRDHDGALELLRAAEQRYDTDYSPEVRPVPPSPPGAARRRRPPGAERWAAGSGLTPDDEPVYRREYEHLTLARVLLASGRAVAAAPCSTASSPPPRRRS